MKIKKILCLITAICIMLTFCACGSGSGGDDSQKDELKPVENENVDKNTSKDAPSYDAEPDVSFLTVMAGDNFLEEWGENNVISRVFWNSLKLSPEAEINFPALSDAIDDFNETTQNDSEDLLYDLCDAAEELYGDEYNPLYLEGDAKILMQRADTSMISFLQDVYMFYGGVHPDYKYIGVNFDTETGDRLTLSDVLTDTDEIAEILTGELLYKYDYINLNEDELYDILYYYEPEDYQWTMDYQGITFWFSPYDIAAYSAGSFSVKLYFEDMPELFEEKYTYAPSENYVVALPLSHDFDFDFIPGDGQKDTVYVYETPDMYGGSYNMLSVTVNSETVVDDINYAYDFDVYLAHVGDKNYIYSDSVSDNGFHMFCTWDINRDLPMQIGKMYSTKLKTEYIEDTYGDGLVYREVFNNPYDFSLETRFEIWGTRNAEAEFMIDKAVGHPKMTDNAYTFTEGFDVVTAIDLDVTMIPEMESTTIPYGTNLMPLRTDGETYVDCITDNGQEMRLEIDMTTWPITVNGIPEDECFEELLYAG